jgi:hypothetical protein
MRPAFDGADGSYTCYGLSISSELELPELIEATPSRSEEEPEVRIRFGEVPTDGLAGGRQLGPYLWTTEDRLWLHVPGVARYLVSGGDSIVIRPDGDPDEDSLRVFLLGSGLGALLFQRGLLVLHGNAIRVGDQCLICVGASGTGKSTLATAFLRRGHDLLADDVVPVAQDCSVLPGFPRIKLWQDTADRFDIRTAGLRRIRPAMEKYDYPVRDRYAGEPLPARWVYMLTTHKSPETSFADITGMDRFLPLRHNTYRVRFMEGMALKATHLKLCGTLAGRIHLARITRPEDGFDIDGLVDRILADVAANP